ncbi:MAG: S-methyl-5-thioribose-1-phosphate isomerase [Pseudonocardiaceae bacterium]
MKMNENGSYTNGALKRVVPPLETVEWRNGGLEVLDQTLLPGWREVRRITSVAAAVDALQRLVVRGAPAIGVFAGFAMVVGFDEAAPDSPVEAAEVLVRLEAEIGNARRTAVNLRWAVSRVAAAARGRGDAGGDVAGMRAAALAEASAIQAQDRASCRRIAKYGLVELAGASRLLTHCNAGRLASTGVGTALAPVYAKLEAGQPVEVVSCETRPLLQGGRLTAWELAEVGVPVTLITDGAAGAAISTGLIDAVIVGCDRVAMNGDTVNKIGTCALAVLAHDADIPFYVAGPLSTFDPDAPDGAEMPIEHRDADEVRRIGGSQVCADVTVWNPAFDLTTARYVTAFITDAGVLRPPFRDSIAAALATGDGGPG